MPDTHEVKCINKTHRQDPHEAISHIGGQSNGKIWKITQQQAIDGVERGEWIFIVRRGGHTVKVVIAKSQFGHKYLKTEADGYRPDNLLSLPECVE